MSGILSSFSCHGMCYFRTFRGIEAYGNGRLGKISHSTAIVEFRDAKLGTLNYLSYNTPTLFVRKFLFVNRPAFILGVVSRRRDAEGRDGFQGIGVMIDDKASIANEIKEYLLETWQTIIDEFDEYADEGFESVFWEQIDKPAHTLHPVQTQSLIFANGNKPITSEHLGLAKELVEADGSHVSTVFLQLDPALRSQGPLSRESADLILKQIAQRKEQLKARHAAEQQQDLARIKQLFDERTETLGPYRPDWANPQSELYLVQLVQYVMNKKRQRSKETAK